MNILPKYALLLQKEYITNLPKPKKGSAKKNMLNCLIKNLLL